MIGIYTRTGKMGIHGFQGKPETMPVSVWRMDTFKPVTGVIGCVFRA